ncbi:MAG: NUDIX domain-containing protein [Hyphomicrobiaceae bacterium]|nr:NUDIX domain-containing protein [Hyphomicrobiaceae bacterium]
MAGPQQARAIQRFEVSLKAAIVHDRRLLLLKEADTGFWELPGGRIDVGEEQLPHEAILAREIREELGANVRLLIRPESASFMRQRQADGVYLFLLVRLAVFDGGTIQLSDEHSDYRWYGPDDWQRLKFPELSDYAAGLKAVWRLVDGIS